MKCARTLRLLLPVFAVAFLAQPGHGQQWEADGPCGLPAVVEGINVEDVCSRLGIGFRPIYGPDGSPWIEIPGAADCGRARAEIERLLAGVPAQGAEAARPPAEPRRAETPLEKWLRENGYASLAEAQADRDAIEKKWLQEQEVRERSDREVFAGRMRRLQAELKEHIARQEALVAAELERKKRAAQAAEMEPGAIPAEAWEKQLAKWKSDLLAANKEVEATRQALLKLVKAQQADVKLFDEWELEAREGFERSQGAFIDLALDLGMGLFVESPDGWVSSYARGLQAKATPEALAEYRRLFGLMQRLNEAKATRDFAALAAREGRTEAEVLEMARDGIGQLSGLLGLDKTPLGKVWKYGSLFFDQAYNLTALFQVWKNVGVLEMDSAAMSEAIQRLSERLQRQMEKQEELRKKIEAGERIEFKDK